MSKDWNIKNGTMVHGGSNRTQLVGCSIELDSATNAYEFFGPEPAHKLEATVPPDVFGKPAKPPFNFPKFKSPLNGMVSRDWYLHVSNVDHPVHNEVSGYWSNTRYHKDPVAGDPDTFTAQAGVGLGEGDDTAAAAAASKQ